MRDGNSLEMPSQARRLHGKREATLGQHEPVVLRNHLLAGRGRRQRRGGGQPARTACGIP